MPTMLGKGTDQVLSLVVCCTNKLELMCETEHWGSGFPDLRGDQELHAWDR